MGSTAMEAIAEYQNDVDRSLRLYFSEARQASASAFSAFGPGKFVKNSLTVSKKLIKDQHSSS